MKIKYITVSIILLALVLGGYFAWNHYKISNRPNDKDGKISKPAKEVIVNLDTNGFTPKTVTIKPGTAIRWKNITDEPQSVNSDKYPTNQLHKELNFGVFNASSSVQYIFTKPGTYGYHNQLHPEQQGTIIVED